MASVSKLALINGALTATTNGDKKATQSRSKKFIGYLKCTAINGATTLTGKIEHSPDSGTNWYTVCTFNALVGVVGTQVIHESAFTVANQGIFPHVRGVATLAGVAQTATVQLDLWFDDDR